MNEAKQRQRLRRFLAAWASRRTPVAIAEIQAEALKRFSDDRLFLTTFLPIALGMDRERTRLLLQAPLAAAVLAELDAIETGGDSHCRRDGEHWVRRAE